MPKIVSLIIRGYNMKETKQSLVELFFFDNSNSPSDPATALVAMKKDKKVIFKNFIIY